MELRERGLSIDAAAREAAGRANGQIASKLVVARKTTANHVAIIIAKLHTADRGHAIVLAPGTQVSAGTEAGRRCRERGNFRRPRTVLRPSAHRQGQMVCGSERSSARDWVGVGCPQ